MALGVPTDKLSDGRADRRVEPDRTPQSSIAWYAAVQKSRQTSGGLGEVQAR
jgi:hypothetical protein